MRSGQVTIEIQPLVTHAQLIELGFRYHDIQRQQLVNGEQVLVEDEDQRHEVHEGDIIRRILHIRLDYNFENQIPT
jgi:hypothetical protein